MQISHRGTEAQRKQKLLAFPRLFLRAFVPLCESLSLLAAGAIVLAARLTVAQNLDPAAWGTDHVGQPVPEFTSGDECLFCHRDVGPNWPVNRHGQTIREANRQSDALKALGQSTAFKELVGEVELILGNDRRQRFLKRSAEFGKLDLLSIQWSPPRDGAPGRLIGETARWDSKTFGESCAGCHASGVDAKKCTFTAASLDCFVCHGQIPEEHTTQPMLAHFSKKKREPAAVVASICGQCHLRTGKSKSTDLPYPNNFVAGDNLFRDYQVDFSSDAISRLNPADAHVLENLRDIVLYDKQDVTCLSCHTIHKPSGPRHHRVADGKLCLNCHTAESKKERKPFEIHSERCGY
jgi:predicted CXXCH cytochrome family protein